jgi:hypothetical protein
MTVQIIKTIEQIHTNCVLNYDVVKPINISFYLNMGGVESHPLSPTHYFSSITGKL